MSEKHISYDYWIPDTPRRSNPVHFSIALILTRLCGITPDLAELIGLWAQAKSAKSPGGKALTESEKKVLRAALQDVVNELT